MFLNFNDNSTERIKFYNALNTVLDITLDEELKIENYTPNLTRMFGAERLKNAIGCATGKVFFFGLTKTNSSFEGLEKHLKLIDSYRKLQEAKKNTLRPKRKMFCLIGFTPVSLKTYLNKRKY